MSESVYEVLARKTRPQRFEEVRGQDHITTTLRHALSAGRIAHAYLLTGPRGCGTTSTARILAKAVNCEAGPADGPCNVCAACRSITEGRALDVIEIDAASHGRVEEARDLREKVPIPPVLLRRKVYIVDEVHQMSREAFDALLKTLEEPPPHILFILATTVLSKVPATIVSRCQRYDFRRISTRELADSLVRVARQENLPLDGAALDALATAAEGGFRDALSLLDQAASIPVAPGALVSAADVRRMLGATQGEVLAALADAVRARDLPSALSCLAASAEGGTDFRRLAVELLEHFRNLLLCRAHPHPETVLDAPDAVVAKARSQAQEFALVDLVHACRQAAAAEEESRRSGHPRLVLELLMVRLCALPSGGDWDEILSRLEGTSAPARRLPPAAPALARDPVAAAPTAASTAAAPAPTPAPEAPALPPAIPTEPGMPVPAVSEIEEAPVSGGFDVAGIEEAWSRIVHRVGELRGPTAAAALASEIARVTGVSGATVTVAVVNNKLALERVSGPENRAAFEQAIREIFPGSGATAAFVAGGASAPAAKGGPAGPKVPTPAEIEEAKKDPAVRAALELFDGEIIEIRR